MAQGQVRLEVPEVRFPPPLRCEDCDQTPEGQEAGAIPQMPLHAVAVAVAVVLEAGLEGRQLLRAKLEEVVAQVSLVTAGQVQPEHFTALVEVDITELAATTVALEAEEDTVGMAPLAEAVVEAHLTLLG